MRDRSVSDWTLSTISALTVPIDRKFLKPVTSPSPTIVLWSQIEIFCVFPLSADIEFINYKASSYTTDPDSDDKASKDYLKSLNKAIDKAYKGAFNFRVGGELKFTTIMARLGAAYYGNPYKNLNGEKGSRFQLSGGLGYRDKGFFIDVAYVHTMGKDVHFPYRLQSAAFTGATIKNTGGNAVLTVVFKI